MEPVVPFPIIVAGDTDRVGSSWSINFVKNNWSNVRRIKKIRKNMYSRKTKNSISMGAFYFYLEFFLLIEIWFKSCDI